MDSSALLRFCSPLLAAALTAACAATSSVGPSKDLRLRHVVLYQNGIGYFERTGILAEDRVRLQFREHEIDDVLKSLVVVEEGAGKAGKRPSTVSARLPEAKDKADRDGVTWLDVVLSPRTDKGLSIAYAVPTAAWKATYRVILPDPARKQSKGALLQAWALIDNVSDEDWSNVMLTLATGAPLSFASDIRSPRFVARPDAHGKMIDPVATGPIYAEHVTGQDHDGDGIADAQDRCPDQPEDLDAIDDTDGCPEEDSDHDGIADGRDACPKEPGAASADKARNGCPQHHRVVVSTNEIRILQKVLFEKGSDAIRAASQPIVDELASTLKQRQEIRSITIEGHAASDEKDVWGLSARRAGAIRAALIAKGVTAQIGVKAFGDTRPLGDDKTDAGRAQSRRSEFHIDEVSDGEAKPGKPVETPAPAGGAVQAASLERAASAASAPRDVAGAIRYDITNPISVPHRSSTLVTIINDYVPGEDVYLFRPDPAAPGTATHPLRAARLENTAFGFQAGSVAVFAGGTFAGEGLIDRLTPGETAMIPYALDSGTTVRVVPETTEKPVRLLALAKGVMTVENASIITTRYEITVGKQAPSRIFVRHPRTRGYEAVELPPRTESNAEAHLVPIPITPGRSSVLTVEERQPRRREIAILDGEGARLGLYLQGTTLPSELSAQVKEIIASRVDLGKIEEEMAALREQIGDVGQRSAELRESLRAIERTPRANPLQKQLMDRLAQATTQMVDLSAKLAERSATHAEARARLTEKLRDVRLEEKKDAK